MSADSKTQHLPPLNLVECASCHNRVAFRFYSSRILDADKRVVYLRCPVCGASATQIQEREKLARAPRRRRYKYTAAP